MTSVTEATLELGTLLSNHFSKLDFFEVMPELFLLKFDLTQDWLIHKNVQCRFIIIAYFVH